MCKDKDISLKKPKIVTCVKHLRGISMGSIVAVSILDRCQNKNLGCTLCVTKFP